jgi:hypothetical protein
MENFVREGTALALFTLLRLPETPIIGLELAVAFMGACGRETVLNQTRELRLPTQMLPL